MGESGTETQVRTTLAVRGTLRVSRPSIAGLADRLRTGRWPSYETSVVATALVERPARRPYAPLLDLYVDDRGRPAVRALSGARIIQTHIRELP